MMNTHDTLYRYPGLRLCHVCFFFFLKLDDICDGSYMLTFLKPRPLPIILYYVVHLLATANIFHFVLALHVTLMNGILI